MWSSSKCSILCDRPHLYEDLVPLTLFSWPFVFIKFKFCNSVLLSGVDPSASGSEKSSGRLACQCELCRSLANPRKVPTHMPPDGCCLLSNSASHFSHDFVVKVTALDENGEIFSTSKPACTIRWTKTRVLPLPAPPEPTSVEGLTFLAIHFSELSMG